MSTAEAQDSGATDALASVTYYRACVGAWRAPLAMRVTDPAALRDAGMRWLDRVSLRLLAAWPRWLGRPVVETTVAFEAPREVLHTTTARWLGLRLDRSVERFTLDPDGRRFTVHGGMTGHGTIDELATRGEYHLRWRGVELVQRTMRDGDLVSVRQEGPGFTGALELVRQPDRRAASR
ncbi:MAG: hypothetical protein KF729_26740 [Sandaracinaceae bacterium]|nr:hypothetical protein [Sandaracinaceae bacterium]